ncbi:MAG TPA: hypothetical protein VF409_07455 [Sphingomonas sp.]
MKYVALPAMGMLCVAAPALAQKKVDLSGERVLADFARCAERAAPRQTRMVMDTRPDSADEKSQIDLLLQKQSNCMQLGPSLLDQALAAQVSLGQLTPAQAMTQAMNSQTQMMFTRRALRGALAERLYLNSVKATAPILPLTAPVDGSDADLPVGYAVVRCAVARDPVSADRLVRSKRLSSDEASAGRALAPALNACARGKGRIDMSGTAIHGWAAEALYKQRRPGAAEGR